MRLLVVFEDAAAKLRLDGGEVVEELRGGGAAETARVHRCCRAWLKVRAWGTESSRPRFAASSEAAFTHAWYAAILRGAFDDVRMGGEAAKGDVSVGGARGGRPTAWARRGAERELGRDGMGAC